MFCLFGFVIGCLDEYSLRNTSFFFFSFFLFVVVIYILDCIYIRRRGDPRGGGLGWFNLFIHIIVHIAAKLLASLILTSASSCCHLV